jgi:hypothetical protein
MRCPEANNSIWSDAAEAIHVKLILGKLVAPERLAKDLHVPIRYAVWDLMKAIWRFNWRSRKRSFSLDPNKQRF